MSGDLLIYLRLTPKGGRDAIDAVLLRDDGTLAVAARVRVPPADGEANAALLRLISDRLDRPLSAIALIRGATSRDKLIRVRDCEAGEALEAFMRPLAQLRRRGN